MPANTGGVQDTSLSRPYGSVATALRNPALLGLPAILFVGVFALWPLAQFLLESLHNGPSFNLIQFQRLWGSGSFWVVLSRTLTIAGMVTLICCLLGYPMAYALTRSRGAVRTVLIGLIALPYLTSVIVRTYAWAAILSLEGPINRALVGLGLVTEPLLLGHSDFGTLIGMVHILLPIAILTLWSGIEKIDPLQRTAAASLGASKSESFLTIYLPQSLLALGSAAVLVYILSLGAYVIPATLGGTRGLLFAQLVVQQATTLLNWNLAAAMAVVMLAAAAIPALLLALLGRLARLGRADRAISRRQYLLSRMQPALDHIPDMFWTRGCQILAALVLIFLLLPELVVVAFSFGPERQITFPPAHWTISGYVSTLSDPSWTGPLRRSGIYAAIDAVIATALGALAAYGFARGRASIARIGTMLLVIPVVLPEIVIAIAYFVFANRWGLTGSAWGIILGQGAMAVGLVAVIMGTIVRQLDVNLEHAAQMCGASRLRVIRDVVLPLIAPGLVVGLIYGFLNAFDNLVLPLFIAGTRDTVPVRMFLSLQEELTSAPAVIASILIAVLTIGLAIGLLITRGSGLTGIIPGAKEAP